jgi:hypothetical protein
VDRRSVFDPNSNTSLADAVGGPLGITESSLPPVAFVAVYAIGGSDTTTAAYVAVGIALLLAIARIVQRQTPQFAIMGAVGVGFAAFIAAKSGKAENFFLPGLLANVAYASAFLISLAVKYPLVGLLVTQLEGKGKGWRESTDPERMRAYVRATWLWAGVFVFRLVVQLPLYLAGAVVALGVAKTAMGVPIFALALWLTWRLVRPRAAEAEPPMPPAASGT